MRTPKFVRKLKTKTPEMLFVGGILCIAGGTVAACVASFKTKEVLDDMNEELEEIREDEAIEEKDKEISHAYFRAGVQVAKYFALPVTLEVAGICMVTKSHNMLKTNVAALGLALNDSVKEFKAYRKRVIDDQGEEADERYRFGITDEEYVETDEEGVETHKSVKVMDPKLPGYSVYARFFDSSSREWTKDPEENLAFLIQTQSIFNDRLNADGYVFLNDVYAALGFDKTAAGHQVGWIKSPGNYVDFGITDIYSVPDYMADAKKRFVNGYENVILLDFNVDGYISDLIGW